MFSVCPPGSTRINLRINLEIGGKNMKRQRSESPNLQKEDLSSLDNFQQFLESGDRKEITNLFFRIVKDDEKLLRKMNGMIFSPDLMYKDTIREINKKLNAKVKKQNGKESQLVAMEFPGVVRPYLAKCNEAISEKNWAGARLLLRAVTSSLPDWDEVDDSYGRLGDFCGEMASHWNDLLAKMDPLPQEELAKLAKKLEKLHKNCDDYGVEHFETPAKTARSMADGKGEVGSQNAI